MIKYLIIDDEHIAHDIIKGYCDLLPNMQLQKNCYDALEAIQYLSENKVDLIFLDLNMPVLKGFDFLKTLSSPPKVIVTTAYSEHAVEGYELDITDYLLKPFSFERFLKAVNKAISTDQSNHTPLNSSPTKQIPKRIFLKGDKKYNQVHVDHILYMSSEGNYTKVVTTEQKIMVREKISDLLNIIHNNDFVQVHRSFAVSIKHIKSIEGNRIYIQDEIIPIGKLYKRNVDYIMKR